MFAQERTGELRMFRGLRAIGLWQVVADLFAARCGENESAARTFREDVLWPRRKLPRRLPRRARRRARRRSSARRPISATMPRQSPVVSAGVARSVKPPWFSSRNCACQEGLTPRKTTRKSRHWRPLRHGGS